jgi:mannonate dehydratase
MARRFAERIHFVHARNVRRTGERDFYETDHTPASGDVDLVAVMRVLVETGFTGPLRPDHGRMIWGETAIPGYGLHDRALGLMYLRGVRDALRSVA